MYLDKTKSRKSVRKILDELHISYTPEQADELAGALLDMFEAVEQSVRSTDAVGAPVCRCNPVHGIHAAFCPCDRIGG